MWLSLGPEADDHEGSKIVRDGFAHLDTAQVNLIRERAWWVEQVVPVIQVLSKLSSWQDVGVVYTTFWTVQPDPGQGRLGLTLQRDRKDSSFVRDATRVLGVKGVKQPSDNNLTVTWKKSPTLEVQVSNYLPASCRVEYVTEYVPGHTASVAKVVCTGGEEDTESVGKESDVPF